MDTCIKNVSEHTWRAFKLEAVRRGLNMGELFDRLVEERTTGLDKSNWDAVLGRGKKLTDAEAKALRKEISEFRKGFDFR